MATGTLLDDSELRRQTNLVVPPGVQEPFGAYFFQTGDPSAELARYVERAVFLDAFGNTPEMLRQEYAPYEASSFFFCIIDQLRQVPVGVMRVLRPSSAGFKSLNDIEQVWGEPADVLADRTGISINLSSTWDIATLGVLPEYRKGAGRWLVVNGLFQCLSVVSLACGIEWFVAILDVPVFRMIRWKLHMIFAGYKGVKPRQYLDSPASLPAWCDCIEAEKRLRGDPALYEILVHGTGLEAALRPLDFDLAARLVA